MADAQQAVAADPSGGAEIERLVAAARDALTDDMVTRLSATLGQGLELLDRFNRSGIDRALPTIARLIENGDLDRLVGMARVVAAMEDSLSDDIVNRVALIATGLASLVDKLARNDGFLRLVDVLGRADVQRALVDLAEAATAAKAEAAAVAPAKGGVGGLWQIVTDPGTQEALRFLTRLTRNMDKR